MLYRRITKVVCLVISAVGTPANAQPITFREVAITGSHACGYNEEISFGLLGSPSINDLGHVTFSGALVGNGVKSSNDQAVFSEGGGNGLIGIARKGEQAPGANSGTAFHSFRSPKINSEGQVVFFGELVGEDVDTTNMQVMYSQSIDRGLELLARQGNQASGADEGVTYNVIIDEDFLNESGNVTLHSSLAGSSVNHFNDRALYRQDATGSLVPLAREADEALGVAKGVRYKSFYSPRVNNNGQAVFVADLTGNATGGSNDTAVFRSDASGVPSAVVREGSQAPGLPAGVDLGHLTIRPVINGHGQVAFVAWLRGVGINGENDLALYRENPSGELAVIAQRGSQVPTLEHGTTYKSMSHHAFNNAGSVVFMGHLTGDTINSSNDYAILTSNSDGEQTLIARHGQQAPGFEPGIKFGSFPFYTERSLRFNNRGQVAFFASTSQGAQGLFATDLNGELQLVVAEGMIIDVSDDMYINEYRFIRNINGNDIEFNDAGELVFWAEFASGVNGIVVATIPAPASTASILVAGCILCKRRR